MSSFDDICAEEEKRMFDAIELELKRKELKGYAFVRKKEKVFKKACKL